MAEAFLQALQMSATEQRDRMRLMRDLVRERNVYRWAAQMLLDAAPSSTSADYRVQCGLC
jgi:trehalose 6-phosphate synthase